MRNKTLPYRTVVGTYGTPVESVNCLSCYQDDPLISRIKKDCERKEEFLKNQTYPAYLSSPPKDIDSSPYGIASLANTMPPPRPDPPPLKQGR